MKNLIKEAVLISVDASFREAVAMMMKHDTNSLLVVGEGGVLVGEINVSDLLDAIVPFDVTGDTVQETLGTEKGFGDAVRAASDVTAHDFMNTDIQPVHVDDSLLTIAGTALAYHSAHLPVVDHDERPIGVISRRGLKHILAKYLNLKES